MNKIGIYGGTYAPIHNGHIHAAVEFKKQFSLDKLLIIPNASPPHKPQPMGDTAEHRLNMLKLVFENEKYRAMGIEISEYEINNKVKNYTVDTLRHFSSDNADLYFLCGSDMLLTMHKWKEPREIAKLCTLVYTLREDRDTSLDMHITEQVQRLKECFGFKVSELCIPPIEMSSTQIRHAKNKRLYVPSAVADYIEKHKLYV